jgi:hypothetical protein
MEDDGERSIGGSRIYRHKPTWRTYDAVEVGPDISEHFDDHFRKYVGQNSTVWHEIISDKVHIDVYIFEPTPVHNWYALITAGMSAKPMLTPPGSEDWRYAELVMCLPPDWPMFGDAFKQDENFWPIRWLKKLARLPHDYDTWLCALHTVPNGEDPQPFARNTELCCALILLPELFGEEFPNLRVNDEKTIHFLSFVPIYKDEMELKLNHGGNTLVDHLDALGVTELLDVRRPSACRP